MRVFLIVLTIGLGFVNDASAEPAYRLLHYDRSFQDKDCINANPSTALCAVETEDTCRVYREPTLCESINHPHYGWFEKRKRDRHFFKVIENRLVTKADISRLQRYRSRKALQEGDTFISNHFGICQLANECMARVRAYNQDLPPETGCIGFFNCSMSKSDDYIYVLRQTAGKWRILLRVVIPTEKYGRTYTAKRVYPLSQGVQEVPK